MFRNVICYSQSLILNLFHADTYASKNTSSYMLDNQATQALVDLFHGLLPEVKNIVIKHRLVSHDGVLDGPLEQFVSAIGALRDGEGSRAGEYFQECKEMLTEILHAVGRQVGLAEEECTAFNQQLSAIIEQIYQRLQHSHEAADNTKADEFIQAFSARLGDTEDRFSTLPEEMRREIYSHLHSLEDFCAVADLNRTYSDEVFGFFRTLAPDLKARLIDEAIASASEPGIWFGIESGAIDVDLPVKIDNDEHAYFNTSVLGLAAYYGYTNIAQILLKKGASAEAGIAPLTIAAWKGYLDIVNILLDNVPDLDLNRLPDGEDGHYYFENCSALSAAAGQGHTEIVKVLVKCGASPDVGYRSALHAVVLSNQIEPLVRAAIVMLLLQAPAGIDVNAVFEGNPALCDAAAHCYSEIVDILAKHPDIDANLGDYSVLIFAAQFRDIHSVRSLLQIPGIDATRMHSKKPQLITPLMMAQKCEHTEIIKLLEAHLNMPALPPLQDAITNG